MGAHDQHDMGHTVAGWAGAAVAVAGSAATGLALVAGSVPGLWLGAVVTALGAPTAWLLHLAGRGKPTGPRPPGRRHWRTRDTAARHGHPGCLGCRLAGRTGAAPARAAAAPAAGPRPARRPAGR